MSKLLVIGEERPTVNAFMMAMAVARRHKKASPEQVSFDEFLLASEEVAASAHPEILEENAPVVAAHRNYRISEESKAGRGKGGVKAKFRANIEAIKLLKKLEDEERQASPAEQAILARYSGWGGIPQVFDAWNRDWDSEREELEGLLNYPELESAKDSTLTAYYTPPEIIRFMYEVVIRLGFQGGRVLEPSLGIGNFFGMMPEHLLSRSKLSGVEIDSLSGRISKQLYPDTDIRLVGYEDAKYPKNFFDLVISNVPFGDIPIHDPLYKRQKFNIHEYFFAKSLDLVRPGGIVAFVTSRYLMDRQNSATRKYLIERADLLGAVRLPSSAFKQSANTDVTSDVIFLQKRVPGAVPVQIAWMEIAPFQMGGKGSKAVDINEYFAQNPGLMLGKLVLKSGMYGREDLSLAPDTKPLEKALDEAVSIFPEGVYLSSGTFHMPVAQQRSIPAPDTVKEGAYVLEDGKLYRSLEGVLVLQELPALTARRVAKLIGIRDILRQLLHEEMQTSDDTGVTLMRIRLNVEYDAFVKEFGFISLRGNRSAFKEDPDYPLLLSLEFFDPETKKAEKAEVFNRRVIHPVTKVEKVDTVEEAFLVTLNELGRVDFVRMAELTGLPESDIRDRLQGMIFQNPDGWQWETADAYLSGNIRRKLETARLAAESDPEFKRNVSALEAVMPKDLDFSEIYPNLGSSWIPAKDIEDFVNELVGVRKGVSVGHAAIIGTWTVEINNYEVAGSVANTTTWGTARYHAVNIIKDTLNGRIPTVRDKVEDKEVVNIAETEAAREKQFLIKGHFREWIWESEERRQRLSRLYNDTFNCLRARTFDGSHLTLPGMSTHLTLMPHQKNAIWRIIQTGNTLLDHEVGAGKTYVIVAAAMEMRRLGLVSKPKIVVPNHLLEQWAAEFLRLYPLANVLITSHEDFTAQKRKAFLGKIATNNWDAVIIGQSSYERIPLTKETVAAYLKSQIDELQESILAAREEGDDSRIVKQLQKAKKRLEANLKMRMDEERKDDGLTFEDLGVDFLGVDESDFYKNLWFATKMPSIAGLPNCDSKRAFDMYMKARLLNESGRPVVFASGTPISNSISEMFTIQRYLQPELLKEYGISHFDSWAQTFGEVVTTLEITPEGSGYRMRARFARFINVPELLTMYRQVADVQTESMLNLERPELEGGKPLVVVAPASAAQTAFVESLVARAEMLRVRRVNPSVDNWLKVTTDGRKAGLDMRLISPFAEDFPDSKINKAVERIYDVWRDTEHFRGTQLVFCDLSTPKGEAFSLYRDIREKLVDRGIPKEEVAFVHEADTDVRRKALWAKMNFGRVRVLLGSTEKMGAGTNVQRLLKCLHHLDVPWRPRDIQQREGRILRQGNTNKSVTIYRYVTEGSFDSYMYQAVEAKARFIAQIKTNEISSRVAEDVNGVVLSYAEVKALASGSPLVLEKFKVDVEVDRLERLRAQHESEQWRIKLELGSLSARVERFEEICRQYKSDLQARQLPKPFEMRIRGSVFTDRAAAGTEILKLALGRRGTDSYEVIGRFAGFDLYLQTYPIGHQHQPFLIARGAAPHKGNISESDIGTIASIEHSLRTMDEREEQYRRELGDLRTRFDGLSKELQKGFPHEEKLRELTLRQYELNEELDVSNREAAEDEPSPAQEESVICAKEAA